MYFMALRIECRDLCMLDQCSTTKLHPPSCFIFIHSQYCLLLCFIYYLFLLCFVSYVAQAGLRQPPKWLRPQAYTIIWLLIFVISLPH